MSVILNYIYQITSERQRCPDAAFIARLKYTTQLQAKGSFTLMLGYEFCSLLKNLWPWNAEQQHICRRGPERPVGLRFRGASESGGVKIQETTGMWEASFKRWPESGGEGGV